MPTPIDDMRPFAGACLLGATIAQGVIAVTFFFAANWWEMPAMVKVGAIDVMLLLSVLGAAFAAHRSFGRAGAVLAAAVLSGVLFAVHGQTWQTGADAWELFALWTFTTFLWAAVMENEGAWLLTALLAVTALILWMVQTDNWTHPDHWSFFLFAGTLALVLGARLVAMLRPQALPPPSWLVAVLLAAIAVLLIIGVIVALDTFGRLLPPATLVLVLSGAVLVGLPPRRFGPWPFTLALIQGVVVAEALLLRGMFEVFRPDGFLQGALYFLLSGGLMLGGIAGLSITLYRLFATTDVATERRPLFTFLLSAVVGIGAWIAVATVVAGISAFLLFLSTDHPTVIFATLAMGSAVIAFILIGKQHPFAFHVCSAFITTAYGAALLAVGSQVMERWHYAEGMTVLALVGIVLLPAVLFVSASRAAATLCTLIAVSLAVGAMLEARGDALMLAVVVLGCGLLGWFAIRRERTSARACGVVLLMSAFVVAVLMDLSFVRTIFHFPPIFNPLYARASAAVVAIGLFAAVATLRPTLREPRILAAAGLTLAASLLAPAGAAALVGLGAVSTLVVGRPLVAAAFAIAAWSVGRFYYDLALPLDQKALTLAVGAVLTAIAWQLIAGKRWQKPVFYPLTLGLALACAAVPIGVEAFDAIQKKSIIATGREVLLALRPVDPRSLLQGDYMALRYDLDRTELPGNPREVYLTLDADGVAQTMRLAEGPSEANEVALKVRYRNHWSVGIAPESFLFQEGDAEAWEKAKYAIVRIKDSTLVLTGLADEERRPIRPERGVKGP